MAKTGKIFKFNRAFTLTELLCALGISAIVILTVYVMILSAHQTFSQLMDASRNTNSFKYFIDCLREDVRFSTKVYTSSSDLHFYDYSKNNESVAFYQLLKANVFSENYNIATNINSAPNPTKAEYFESISRIITGSNKRYYKVLYYPRKIYFFIDEVDESNLKFRGGYKKLNMGIIYDQRKKDVILRQNRKMFCLVCKG